MRWGGLKNGELLKVAEEAGFDVFVTGDRLLEYEQNVVSLIAVQLARNAGAKVIGLSSDADHKWLAGRGVIRLPMMMARKIESALHPEGKSIPSLTHSVEVRRTCI